LRRSSCGMQQQQRVFFSRVFSTDFHSRRSIKIQERLLEQWRN
jgi:hypothetical protein